MDDSGLHAPAQNREYAFPSMKLKIGDRLQLQLPPPLAQEKHTVRLIGYCEGVSLLVMPPHGFAMKLVEGENIVVRFFSGEHVFGFTSTLDHIVRIPFEYLHLSFPEKVQGVRIRKFPRIQTRLDATVSSAALDGHPLSCTISDISISGASLLAEADLGKEGENVIVSAKLEVLGNPHELELNEAIRSCSGKGEEERHYGIEFQKMDAGHKLVLSSFIYQESLEEI
ncbi:MAG: flagellar brake protein [Burkholderiales bacterium]|nr:flagellar brake protein [Burkholderiales bacterium]